MGERKAASEDRERFVEWLDAADLELRVAVKREHDKWFALLVQFDITGMGDSPREALNEAFSMMVSYLHAFYEEGQPVESAVRPVPVALRARIELEGVFARILRAVSLRIPLADESTYELPPGQLSKLALC